MVCGSEEDHQLEEGWIDLDDGCMTYLHVRCTNCDFKTPNALHDKLIDHEHPMFSLLIYNAIRYWNSYMSNIEIKGDYEH